MNTHSVQAISQVDLKKERKNSVFTLPEAVTVISSKRFLSLSCVGEQAVCVVIKPTESVVRLSTFKQQSHHLRLIPSKLSLLVHVAMPCDRDQIMCTFATPAVRTAPRVWSLKTEWKCFGFCTFPFKLKLLNSGESFKFTTNANRIAFLLNNS